MGPHASEREGERVLGGTARLGGGGEEPIAGGYDGVSPMVARFSEVGEVG
jgi:hypothetical protein